MRTISFKLLYGLVIRAREKIRVSVTTNPTAEWIAGQVTEAFPWNEAPRRLTRDRDRSFGPAYTHRIRAMGIRDHPTAPRAPCKTLTSSDSSAQFVGNASIIWWWLGRRTCAGS